MYRLIAGKYEVLTEEKNKNLTAKEHTIKRKEIEMVDHRPLARHSNPNVLLSTEKYIPIRPGSLSKSYQIFQALNITANFQRISLKFKTFVA